MKIGYPLSCICLLKNLDFRIQRGSVWLTRSCSVLIALLGPRPCFGGTRSHRPSNPPLLNTVLRLYFQYRAVGQWDVAKYSWPLRMNTPFRPFSKETHYFHYYDYGLLCLSFILLVNCACEFFKVTSLWVTHAASCCVHYNIHEYINECRQTRWLSSHWWY